MTLYLFMLYGALGVIFLIALYNAVTAPLLTHGPAPVARPLVSILVPARNEERNIQTCLASLCAQAYDPLEIIVLDDHSRDDTAAMVKAYAGIDARIQLVEGESLPAGWTGKNWACHQLSRRAQGDILIFTDADNFYTPGAVSRSVGWIEKLDLALLSAFPQQITVTLAEKLIVPVYDLFVYALLPLRLTYSLPHASLSAANGQWMAFTRDGYHAVGGHAAVRSQVVEDTALSRRAKRLGFKTLTASGRDAVMGRMYHNWREVWYGFAKNAFGLMEYKTVPFFLFLAFLFFVFVLPFILIWNPVFFPWMWPAVIINLALRLMLALKFKQPLVAGVLLHPLGIVLTILVGWTSFYYYLLGNIVWKDRQVPLR